MRSKESKSQWLFMLIVQSEDIFSGAIREVKEETGVCLLLMMFETVYHYMLIGNNFLFII
jgi:8-oxo-dGTP pyrophosphatase MutT (NUDIX family)